MACWSHAVHEAHDQFAAERQVQKLALLNIRVTQSGEVRIDDDFEKLMLQVDEIEWREERFNACMTGRGYIKPVYRCLIPGTVARSTRSPKNDFPNGEVSPIYNGELCLWSGYPVMARWAQESRR